MKTALVIVTISSALMYYAVGALGDVFSVIAAALVE